MKKPPHAYTLIECVLALGLVAMVLASLLALLPMGLSTMAGGGRRVAEARIMQHLQTRCRSGLSAGDLYFSREGSPLETGAEAAFIARLETEAGVFLPGDAEEGLRRIRVMISDQPQASPFADDLHVTARALLLAQPLDGKVGS